MIFKRSYLVHYFFSILLFFCCYQELYEIQAPETCFIVQEFFPSKKRQARAIMKKERRGCCPKFATGPFYDQFAKYMNIFHKTGVRMVILRGLRFNWLKRYDTISKKNKIEKNKSEEFFTKLIKNGNGNICVLCHNI